MLRAFIIHGWDGYPDEGWFPWAQTELEKHGYQVTVPAMPDSDTPTIKAWVEHLTKLIPEPDEDTLFIGHSIGCQTIMRYLELLPNTVKIKQAIFVAGWFTLINIGDENSQLIAKPWLETPINFEKILVHTKNITAILSTDDPVVPFEENKDLFIKNLKANIIITSGGHLGGQDNINTIPAILERI